MAVTWVIDDYQFVNQARREITVLATRTDGAKSRQYRLPSFLMREGVSPGDEGDRLVADLKAIADADKSWNVPELAELFPNAGTVLAAKLDALEV